MAGEMEGPCSNLYLRHFQGGPYKPFAYAVNDGVRSIEASPIFSHTHPFFATCSFQTVSFDSCSKKGNNQIYSCN